MARDGRRLRGCAKSRLRRAEGSRCCRRVRVAARWAAEDYRPASAARGHRRTAPTSAPGTPPPPPPPPPRADNNLGTRGVLLHRPPPPPPPTAGLDGGGVDCL